MYTRDNYTCMMKDSYLPYTSIYSSTRYNTNRKHNIHHIPYTNTQHTLQGLKKHSSTTAATQQTFPQTPAVTITDIKTNMSHLHTSIVYMHLAIRGNNTILRPPPIHISSSGETLPRFTLRTIAKLRTNKSHSSTLYPLCNAQIHNTHHLFNCTHIRTTLSTLDLWTDPAGVTARLARWSKKLADVPHAGRSDSRH